MSQAPSSIILITEIVGSTASLEIQQSFRTVLEELTDVHQGTLLNLQQDSALLTFTEAETALQFARELQTRFQGVLDIPARIGIHYGQVPMRDNMPMGYALYIAKQIERKADPGMILLSGEVRNKLKANSAVAMQDLDTFFFPQANQAVDVYTLSTPGLGLPKRRDSQIKTRNSSLKTRRLRVLQMFVAYLVGAWTILEFIDWTLERYQLSPYWVDILFWTFLGLIPSILFYLLIRWQNQQVDFLKRDRPIYFLNLGILLVGLFLGFGSKELGSVKKGVPFVNKDGNIEIVRTVREAFRTTLMVFPFSQTKVDSSAEWGESAKWGEFGLPVSLEFNLQQDHYLTVFSSYEKENEAEKIRKAQIYKTDYYLDGTYSFENGIWNITPTIRNTSNGLVEREKTFKGADVLSVLDAASLFVREAVGLSPAQMQESVVLPLEATLTTNEEALKYGLPGLVYDKGFNALKYAARFDSSFALVNLGLARWTYDWGTSKVESLHRIKLAMQYRQRLPFAQRVETEIYSYLINGNAEKAKALILFQLELYPKNVYLQEALLKFYWDQGTFTEVLQQSKRLYKEIPTRTNQLKYLQAALVNEKYALVIKAAKATLKESPEDMDLRYILGEAYLHKGQYAAARKNFKEMMLLQPESEPAYAIMLEVIDFQEKDEVNEELLRLFEGTYRSGGSEITVSMQRMGIKVYQKVSNTAGKFVYPLRDSLIDIDIGLGSFFSSSLLKNEEGKVYAIKDTRTGNPWRMTWKQDSVIWQAEALLEQKKYKQAQVAYQKAIEQHPEHYYLYNALQHIEYRLSRSDKEWEQQARRVSGVYELGRFKRQTWYEEGKLYSDKETRGTRMELLFLSDTEATTLWKYEAKGKFIFDKDVLLGNNAYLYNRETKEWEPWGDGEMSKYLGKGKIF